MHENKMKQEVTFIHLKHFI